ncbi:hypothetical protein CLV56_1035 [Mumia flava]|uniref:TIGR01777 family protein n=1 Tax=Mumia flava TaxID=1348852 RepID=A0A0B2BKG5_9ACTN|nr:TIGR01777 family oxidoreductase [Mumia flava]PJJ56822.1 hypothetical protein CLV56_1035 [Mumia flava]
MSTYTHVTRVGHRRDEVFAWHERPGAVTRLTPPTFGRVEQEPSDGLRDGSRAVLRINVPATSGLLRLRWVARHRGYRPPHSFEDEMESGPLGSWQHRHTLAVADPDGITEIIDEIDAAPPLGIGGLPGRLFDATLHRQLDRMFSYRARQLRADLDFHARRPAPRTIAVSGASGTVGRQLVALLGGGGHRVRRLVRRPPRTPDEIRWDPARGRVDAEKLRDVDVVIHLAGEPIGGRFTESHKRAVYFSRVRSTRLLATTLADLADDGRARALVSASAVGWYGPDRGDEILDEDDAPGTGFLADVCRSWEDACAPARDAGVRVVNVRTGLVQSAAGGPLALQAPIFATGLGGPLGDGSQWLGWITIDDLVRLYGHVALTDGLDGPVNACAPEPVRAEEYARVLGRVLHRPHALRVPAAAPALLLGREGAHELALAGQRTSAKRAQEWGVTFEHPDLASGLRHVLAADHEES